MMVDWVGDETSDVDPNQSSWETPLFQFASALPPSSSVVTVHEGDLSTFADGLIVAPGSLIKPRSAGYWKHQFYAKKPKESYLDRANYLTTIGNMTNVVDFQIGLSGTASSDMVYSKTVLATLDNSDMREKAKKQLLALWLNVASHKMSYYAAVSYDPEAVTTTADTVKKAIDEIEAAIENANATLEELENAKDMAEILNCK